MNIDYSLCPINLGYLKNRQSDIIKKILVDIPEEKIIVFDPNVTNIIDNIITHVELKTYNVIEMYYTNSFTYYKGKCYIYFVLPTQESIAFMNNSHKFLANGENNHIICFLRKRDIKIENSLHYDYIWDHVTIIESCIGMVPVEHNTISMCMQNSFSKLCIDRNVQMTKQIIECLEIMQRLYGRIPEINAFGDISLKIKLAVEKSNKINKYNNSCQINKLILLDRSIDTITPCLTQLTYEGVIDDVIGISNCKIKIENAFIPLNSGCPFYPDIRDKHISISRTLLKTYGECYNLKNLNAKQYAEDSDSETQKFILNVLKQNKLHIDYLSKHIKINNALTKNINSKFFQKTVEIENLIMTSYKSENLIQSFFDSDENSKSEIFNYIDKSISDNESIYQILACLSLYFQIHGQSINKQGYENLISMLVDKYDYCYKIINYLEKLGMMAKKNIIIDQTLENVIPKEYSFKKTISKLNLIKDIDFKNTNHVDICGLYGGYAPISGKLIENAQDKNGVTLVCFVGGCNYSEISACRLNGNIIVLTTEIFNKKQFFDSLRK